MNINTTIYDPGRNGIPMQNIKMVAGKNAFRTTCPHCSETRSTSAHRKEKVLEVNTDTGYCHCYHCDRTWRMDSNAYLDRKHQADTMARRPTHYTRPKAAANERDADHFTEPIRQMLAQRGIPLEVAKQAGVTETVAYMPEIKASVTCIAFNYWEQQTLVYRKYRDLSKHFKADSGAEPIPFHLNSCLGQEEVVVTEGEFDTMAMMAAGISSVVSIPNGANDSCQWMERLYDLYFKDKKRIYLATDMDRPGMKAAEELARRFGPECCLRVTFDDDCKDANEQLMRHGADSLRQCVQQARPVPLRDIYTLGSIERELDTLYEQGPQPGSLTGWWNLDDAVSFAPGQLALLTGRANDGKSEFLDELVLRLLLRTGWNAGYWSPENTLVDHSRKLIEKLSGRSFVHKNKSGLQPDVYRSCKRWLKRHVSWVSLPFTQLYLKQILERCRSMVRKYGIRILVIDPFNFIEKENNAQRSENAWDSHVVGALRNFAIEYGVLVFLVAHPRKVEMQIDGRKRRITMEDISGTADFGNKADYCFCIDRDDEHHLVTVYVDKVRRKQYGSKGRHAHFVYQPFNGRYIPCKVDANHQPEPINYADYGGCWIDAGSLFDTDEEEGKLPDQPLTEPCSTD